MDGGHDDGSFNQTAQRGGQGGSSLAHGRTSQVSKDHDPVQEDVGHHGDNRCDHRNHRPVGRPEAHPVYLGDCEEEESEAQHAHVRHSAVDDRLVLGEDAHDPLRGEGGEQEKDSRSGKGDIEGESGDLPDSLLVPRSIELGEEDRAGGGDAEEEQGDQKIDLSCQSDRRDGCFPQLGDHQRVDEIQAVLQDLLEKDWDGDGQELTEKRILLAHRFPLPCL